MTDKNGVKIKEGDSVLYAGSEYVVADVSGWMVGIYDEDESLHVDYLKPDSVEVVKRKLNIKTLHVFPPIPIRSHDWCAWEDGEDHESPHGWGATEEEAKRDLIQQLEDEEE